MLGFRALALVYVGDGKRKVDIQVRFFDPGMGMGGLRSVCEGMLRVTEVVVETAGSGALDSEGAFQLDSTSSGVSSLTPW